jgi:hypothetical protein
MKGDFSRLKGDFSRHTFATLKHYAAVLHQQGRVWLDSDWNDEVLLRLNLLQQETFDIVGKCGAPAPGTAFKISPPSAGSPLDAFEIAGGPGPEGRYYVDGILCQLDTNVTYLTQPDFPNPPRLSLPTRDGELIALVYLEVWQRLITYLEDENIREVALGGPDTGTRLKTIAQVKVLPLPAPVRELSCEQALATLPVSGGTLSTLPPTDTLPPDPCRLPDPASFTGRENHLYRVEIHDGGDPIGTSASSAFSIKLQSNAAVGALILVLLTPLSAAQSDALRRSGAVTLTDDDGQFERVPLNNISADGRTLTISRGLLNAFTTAKNATVTGGVARFKWSSDNAAFAVRVTAISPDRKTLTLASLGRDQVTALREGDLIELSDDPSELGPAHGLLTYLTADPNPDTFTVTIADSLPPGFGGASGGVASPPGSPPFSPPEPAGVGGNLILRRWDGQGAAQGAFNEITTPQLNLGDGVHIEFGGSNLQSGDYWEFPARSIDGSVELLDNVPPMGITRHRCALALVRFGSTFVFNFNTLTAIFANFPPVLVELKKTGRQEFDEATILEVSQRVLSPAQFDSSRRLLESTRERARRSTGMTVLEDCRKPFRPLTDLQTGSAPEPGIHINRVQAINLNGVFTTLLNDSDVLPDAILGGINVECDMNIDPASISRPTCYVTVETASQFGDITIAYQTLTLKANVSAANKIIAWRPEPKGLDAFLRQLMRTLPRTDRGILARLTLKGNFIWGQDNPGLFLDGEAFGLRRAGRTTVNTDIHLPSGDTRRGGDFMMWFWLVSPGPTLTGFTFNPTTIRPGSTSIGTLTLSAVAPAGDAIVNLASSNPTVINMPATVTIPAGSPSATFRVTNISGFGPGIVTITATYNGVSLTADLVFPPQP